MSALLYPSDFVLSACGRQAPEGVPATTAGRCTMCGKPHGIGDEVLPFEPESSFTDYAELAQPGSAWLCTACMGVWNGEFTQTYAKVVVTPEGIFPAAKNDHIAWWLMNPPSTPWMFFLSDQKRQHLVWRTPVNRHSEIFQVRFGNKVLSIRHAMLAKAITAVNEICAALSKTRKGAPFKSPYRSLNRELSDFAHSQLRSDAYQLVEENSEMQGYLHTLLSLTAGEIWALTAVLYAKDPHRPDPVLTPASN